MTQSLMQRFQNGAVEPGLFDKVMSEAYSICDRTLKTRQMTWEEQLFLDKFQKHLVANGIIDNTLRKYMSAIGRLGMNDEIEVIHK